MKAKAARLHNIGCVRKPADHPSCQPEKSPHQLTIKHHQQAQKQDVSRNTKCHGGAPLTVTVLSLLVVVISLPNLIILQNARRDLKTLIYVQKGMIERRRECNVSDCGIAVPPSDGLKDAMSVESVLQYGESLSSLRGKRSAVRRRKSKRGRKRKKRRKSKAKMTAVHLMINPSHPDLQYNWPIKVEPTDEISKYWTYSIDEFNRKQTFAKLNASTGHIVIQETALYYFYAQITDRNSAGRMSYQVKIDDQPFLKCLQFEWGIDQNNKTGIYYENSHQCFTAGVTLIKRDQKVTIYTNYEHMKIMGDSGLTFMGVVQFL